MDLPTHVIAGAIVGAACLAASFHYGTQFYPPGYGYEEERRNDRRALVLLAVGIASIVGPLLM